MQKDLFISKIYGYTDCLEARLYDEAIDTMVYLQLIETTRTNLASLLRLLKLKKELLGLDKMRYEDVYASSVKSVERLYTVEEAREIVVSAMKPLGEDYANYLKKVFAYR
ncbi:MAG: hypothetical protein WC703_08145 [Candidatus Neomarinimicrobiota bacterium]